MGSKVYFQLLVSAMVISTISASFYSSLFRRQFSLGKPKSCIENNEEAMAVGQVLYDGKQCTASMQCAWELCSRNSEEGCSLLCNSCSCPPGTRCQRDMLTRTGGFGFIKTKSEFRCMSNV